MRRRANAVRLQFHAPAYDLPNLRRTLVLPDEIERWSLTTLRKRVVKIGATVLAHARRMIFQLTEVTVSQALFRRILDPINMLPSCGIALC